MTAWNCPSAADVSGGMQVRALVGAVLQQNSSGFPSNFTLALVGLPGAVQRRQVAGSRFGGHDFVFGRAFLLGAGSRRQDERGSNCGAG